MLELQGIEQGSLIHANAEFELYNGRYLSSARSACLIKAPTPGALDPGALLRLNREIRIVRALKGGAPALLEVRSHQRGSIQILEHPEGELLAHILERNPLRPEQSLRAAIAIAAALEAIHAAQVVHRSLAPERIFVDVNAARASVIDFSRAARLSRLNRQRERSTDPPQNLICMAPEQSGRTNRDSDHRTDLYALGVILFWMLAGRPPFQAASPGEWVYLHLAAAPPLFKTLRPELPPMLDEILARLLAKDPEQRYRSVSGLIRDLRTAEDVLQGNASGDGGIAGQDDPPERFGLSQRLYGRDRELELLAQALASARQGRLAAVVVEGEAGAGKSALLREVETVALRQAMFFSYGRFDALEAGIPYRAWLQAARRLLADLQVAGGSAPASVRAGLQSALGNSAAALIQLLPELALWLGPQAAAEELPAAEARNRLHHLFLTFFREFAAGDRSLALVLDDLQWADLASIDLLRSLLHLTDVRIAVLLSSRPADELSRQRLGAAMEELRRSGSTLQEIQLGPLRAEDLAQMIAESLAAPWEEALSLAAAVHVRTGGNAFYSLRLLYAGAGEGWIRYDAGRRRWSWNLEGMGAVVPGSITEFLVGRLAVYSEQTRQALGALAHIGAAPEEELFQHIWAQLRGGDASDPLEEALADGLISFRDEGERRLIEFAHDRVQEAAAALLGEDQATQLRLHVGRRLLQKLDQGEAISIFAIVRQLNGASVSDLTQAERMRLIELNLSAAAEAMRSAAWDQAAQNSRAAIALQEDQLWSQRPELAARAWSLALESEYLSGDYGSAEQRFAVLVQRCKDLDLVAAIHQKLVVLYTNQGRHGEAIRMGLRGLRLLGLRLRERPGKAAVLWELGRLEIARRGLSAADFQQLPLMHRPRLLIAMELMMALAPPAFFTDQNLFAVLSLRMARFSLRHGLSGASGYAFMIYAALLTEPLGRHAEADRIGRVAMEINEAAGSAALRARILVIYGGFINHWQNPMRSNHSYLRRAFRSGLETGDLVYAGYALANRIFCATARGEPLPELTRLAETFLRFTDRSGDRDVEGDFLLALHSCQQLSGQSSSALAARAYDAAEHLRQMQSGNPVTLIFRHFLDLRDGVLFGQSERALQAIALATPIFEPARPLALGVCFEVYVVLALSQQLRKGSLSRRMRWRLRQAEKRIRRLRRDDPAPHFETQQYFVEGEARWRRGDLSGAISAFSKAQRSAIGDEDLPLAAIAALRSAELLETLDARAAADSARAGARLTLERWGARKVAALLHPGSHPVRAEVALASSSPLVAAALNAARAISGEITLERLAPRALEAIMVVSGARRGAFLTPNDTELRVRAFGAFAADLQVEAADLPAARLEFLPQAVLQRVHASQQAIAQYDVREQLGAVDGPEGARSLYCAPVLQRGRLIALLYLDNDLAPGIFTPERIELIGLLSAQAAAALDNASLYAQLEDRVATRTQELQQTLRQLRELKLQQDLDYYLISQLVEPLSSIRYDSKRVAAQAFTRQIKQFQFKRWNEQIGGDISLVRRLQVGQRDCAVFVNADAMGKSLQGAGGVLILAAVFEALTVSGRSIESSPEAWLHRCYREFSLIFSSFSGYMMASCILGVIDAGTGDCWLSLSDHPPPALLEGGEVRLLSEATQAPRLGMPVAPDLRLPIHHLRLSAGASLLAATDGRDDLLLGDSEEARKLVSSPEVFLAAAREAMGDPAEIYQLLQRRGQLTDDISILRLKYLGPAAGDTVP
ncbi:MAG: AAA family ATPase [Leptospirales bacterium]|nr:AAA family ATPase [Leptospirales bacterium]